MQLNQPIPPPYSGGDNQYDFILNGNQKPKKGLLPKGETPKQRVLLVVGGLGVLVLFAIIFALIFGGGKGSTQTPLALAQTQNEIIRVSGIGGQLARDTTTQGFTETVNVTITTSQQQTIKYLSAQKFKIKPKILALAQNSKTDATLRAAAAAGRYDEALKTVLEQELSDYRTQVSAAYKATSDKTQKALYQQLFNQVTILIKNQPATNS